MGRNLILFVFFLLFPLIFPPQASSLDSRRDITQYSHRAWLKRDGLPQNSVISLAQSADGFLWVGTYEGLARFDGTSFTIFNRFTTPAITAKFVQSLCAATDSTLWIGVGGGGLVRYRDGVFTKVILPGEVGSLGTGPIFQDSHGLVWASTYLGLACFQGDSLRRMYTTVDGLPQNFVTGITEGGDGNLVAAAAGRLVVLQGGCFVPHPLAEEIKEKVRLLASDRRGGFWIGLWEGGLMHAGDGSRRRYTAADGLPATSILSLYTGFDGTLWVGTLGGGVVRIVPAGGTISRGDASLAGDDVLSLLEDREGNVWVGSGTGGLNCFSENKFTTFSAGPTAPQNFLYAIFEDRRGTIHAGTANRELVRLEKGRFVTDARFPSREAGVIMAFHEDHRGDLWIGATSGVYLRRGESYERTLPVSASSLVEDSYGRLWAGTSRGLYVRHGGKWTPYAGPFQEHGADIRYLAIGAGGRLWVGTRNSGLVGFSVPRDPGDSGKTVPADTVWYGRWNGLRSNLITYIREDSSGRLWVSSFGGGLTMIEGGEVKNLCLAGPAEDGFFTALDDRCGYLWLSSNTGVYRVSVADLLQVASGGMMSAPWTRFGLGAGMTSDECNGAFQSSGFRGRDGRLWFPTTAGAVMVAPDSLPTNLVPPAVVLEHARINREEVLRTPGIASSFGDREFEFAYTGISLSAPDLVQFRVMLEGYDNGFIDVGERKICSYTNLSPGSYIFRVQARNADGVWNRAGASFPFLVSPRFYQTWWFSLLCALGVMTAGAGLHAVWRRDRDRQLVAAQLESRLAQAQLKVLEMQVQPHFLFNTLNGISVLIRDDPEKARSMITRLSEFVRMALDRSGVQEISLREELLFVDRYLQIELLRFADRLTVKEEVDDALLDALVPAMILQPLVENAIRHGVSKRRGPVTIRIAASRDNGSLSLHVCDNGAGLALNGGGGVREGIGLTNTRERLRQLYGEYQRLDFVSVATGGVDVALTIPYHMEPVPTWTESAR